MKYYGAPQLFSYCNFSKYNLLFSAEERWVNYHFKFNKKKIKVIAYHIFFLLFCTVLV